jgi:hypothetical protein
MIHFEGIYVKSVRVMCRFNFSFTFYFPKNLLIICGSIYGISVLFQCAMSVFVGQYHTALIILIYMLKWDNVSLPTLFFFSII